MFEIMVEDTFASAHQLIGYEGACENIHGHTWKVQIFLKGETLGKIGMLYDFKKVKASLGEIIKKLDHKNLNRLPEFASINPTAENLAKMIYDMFELLIPEGVEISKTTVWESEKTCATYTS